MEVADEDLNFVEIIGRSGCWGGTGSSWTLACGGNRARVRGCACLIFLELVRKERGMVRPVGFDVLQDLSTFLVIFQLSFHKLGKVL